MDMVMPCRHKSCSYHTSPQPCPHHAQGQEAEEYEVQNPKIEALLRSIGRTLKSKMPPNYGFSLFIFSYGEGGDSCYISSADREDFLTTLQEFMVREAYVYMSSARETKRKRN